MSLRDRLEEQESFIFRFQTFSELKESLYGVFGASAYTIVYYAGVGAGKSAYGRRFEKTKTGAELLKLFVEDKSSQNWGEIVFDLDFAKSSGKVLVKNCFEARAVKSKQPVCYFIKGYLTGFLTVLMQKPVNLSEVRCLAKGDEYCEFIVTPEN